MAKFNNILFTKLDKLEKLVSRNEDLRIRPFGCGYGRFRTSHQRYGIESELITSKYITSILFSTKQC